MKRWIFIFGFSVLLFASVFPTGVFAIEGPIGITIVPAKYVFETDPGAVIEKSITVINPNDFELRARPEFQDFKVTEGNNIQWIPSDVENPFKMTDWIQISDRIITLSPKGQATIPFTIRVPKNASAGGHYAALFFTAVIDEEGGNVGSIPRVGSLVILNVSGDVIKTGKLLDFISPLFVTSGPVDFSFKFINTGTTHYSGKGGVTIKNIFGSKTELTSEEKFVYPNIERIIKAKWENENPLGIYFVKASIIDGEGNEFSKSKIMFAVPMNIILPVLGILLFLYAAWRLFKKKFKIIRA